MARYQRAQQRKRRRVDETEVDEPEVDEPQCSDSVTLVDVACQTDDCNWL